VLGLLFFPLQAYALWLLLRIAFRRERLGPVSRRRAALAMLLSLPIVIVPLLVWLDDAIRFTNVFDRSELRGTVDPSSEEGY